MTSTLAETILENLRKNGVPVRSESALTRFIQKDLPHAKAEEYKFTPIQKILSKNWDNPVNLLPGKTEISNSFIETSLKIVFFNGKLDKEHSELNADGLQISPLDSALKEELEHEAFEDPFQLLNEASFTDGILISVGKNNQVERPVEIIHVIDNESNAVVSLPRIYIKVNEFSKLRVIEHYQFEGKEFSFQFPVHRYSISQNANLEVYTLQTVGESQIMVANTVVDQAQDSTYTNYTYSLKGHTIRNNHSVIHLGQNIETYLNGLTLLQGKDHVDHHTIVDHREPHCYSNEQYKGIFDEMSTGVFNGRIFVREDAQKTNAFQSNNNVLLSDKATIHTKPQLEIWADDVKCSHGCTSGQLDDEALYYLRSRGIGEKEARGMLLKAFAGEILESVAIPELKDYISNQIDQRL